jgi:superfamily I DNA/RNA helicase
VVISTAHKAKGLEWDSVKIAADFKAPAEGAVRTRRANRLMDYYAVDLADLTIESVFEGEYDDRGEIGRRDMLRFIQAAGEKIEAM